MNHPHYSSCRLYTKMVGELTQTMILAVLVDGPQFGHGQLDSTLDGVGRGVLVCDSEGVSPLLRYIGQLPVVGVVLLAPC